MTEGLREIRSGVCYYEDTVQVFLSVDVWTKLGMPARTGYSMSAKEARTMAWKLLRSADEADVEQEKKEKRERERAEQ